MYGIGSTYINGSFFEEDEDIMVNMLLDLALNEKNMYEDNFQTAKSCVDINEYVRRTAFGGSGIGMASTGSGNILTNAEFLSFQKEHFTPH